MKTLSDFALHLASLEAQLRQELRGSRNHPDRRDHLEQQLDLVTGSINLLTSFSGEEVPCLYPSMDCKDHAASANGRHN